MYMGEQHLLQMAIAQTFGRLESAADLSETRGEQGVTSTWVYPHEEVVGAWWFVYPLSILLFGVPFLDDAHVEKHEVDLLFEGNKLVSWETRPAPSAPKTGAYSYQNPFPSTMTYPSKDTQHHRKGHKHHHGHGC